MYAWYNVCMSFIKIINYDGNIKGIYWSMSDFVGFILDEFAFMKWIEKKTLTFEMKRLTKIKYGRKKSLIKEKIWKKIYIRCILAIMLWNREIK